MNKHIELFKTIPCGNFVWDRNFFKQLFENPNEFGTRENILLAYYYIADEMCCPDDPFIVRYDKKFDEYCIHTPIIKSHEFIKTQDCKIPKFYKGIFNNSGYLNTQKTRTCLIPTPKNKDTNIEGLIENFRVFAELYKRKHFANNLSSTYYPDISNAELDHLYKLLKKLLTIADISYKQSGSIVLAQDMASILSNDNICANTSSLALKYDSALSGNERLELVHKHKQLILGELKKTFIELKTKHKPCKVK